jgi:hypothetical protein
MMSDAPEEQEDSPGKLPPGTVITWDQAAEAMRMSTGAIATEVYSNISDTNLTEVQSMTAIATGALGWAVNAYFRYWIATGMQPSEIRKHLDRNIKTIWEQSIFLYREHREEAARRASEQLDS